MLVSYRVRSRADKKVINDELGAGAKDLPAAGFMPDAVP